MVQVEHQQHNFFLTAIVTTQTVDSCNSLTQQHCHSRVRERKNWENLGTADLE
jgi:hypothetical protein